jgi:serine/threonine protein kinase/tetratricopeptide (TPR) repeat protein
MSTPERDWRALSRLLDTALSLPASERAAWLQGLDAGQQPLKQLLEELLARGDLAESGGFLASLPKLDSIPNLSANPGPIRPAAEPGQLFGAYRLERMLGTGGMGSVWLAERSDGLIKRKVALKLPHFAGETAGLAERMDRERNILATLQHPNIARLYDAGVASDGRPYLALEFVEGEPIDRYCAVHGLDRRQCISLFVQVARAVAFAHAHLVIHRDLKPTNILVDTDGVVHLLDFGIATLLDPGEGAGGRPESGLTRQLGVALTPQYASPEQIRGERVSTASDVYSLGLVLYQLLAGQRPYQLQGADQLALSRAIEAVKLTPPSAAATDRATRRALQGDLDTIVLKALRKAPAERYTAVGELADDLERYLHGEPVRARPAGTWYRARKFAIRNKGAVAGAAGVVGALVLGLAIVSWEAHRIAIERDIARNSAAREEAIRYYLTNMFRSSVAASSQGSEATTAKAMLDLSAQRVLREYRNDPYLAGKVVETLSDLYGALEDVDGEKPLLEGFLAQAATQGDPEAVADARQKLANIELLRGNTPRAAELLALAQPFWARDPRRYREERLEGLAIQARVQRAQGDLEGSVRTSEEAIRQRLALFGLRNRETAVLYNSLGITLSQLNRVPEALAAFSQALAIYAALGQSDELDALIMLGNTGTLAARYGQLARAQQLLGTAVAKERATSGDSAAVAAAMGYYGWVMSAYGRYDQALSTLRQATALAERFTGADSPLTIRDRGFLVEALWGAGQREDAEAVLKQTLALSVHKYGASGPLTLDLAVTHAELAESAGRASEAQAEVGQLIPALRGLGVPAAQALAQALLIEGEALLARSQAAAAITPLTEAVELRQRLFWDRSWELAVARARLGEALAIQHDPRGRALLRQAVDTLREQLGPRHPQTLRAQSALDAAGI